MVLRGTLDLYRAKGEISLILAEIDVTALLGSHGRPARPAAAHARGRGTAAGQRRRCPCPTSPCTSGWWPARAPRATSDFLGQLTGSGFGFRVSLRRGAGAGTRTRRRPSPAPCMLLEPQRLRRHRPRPRRRIEGGPGRVRDRDRGPGRRHCDQAGLHRHRAHGRRDRGRHRGGPRLHHADRVRARSIVVADPPVVGRPRGRAGRRAGPAGAGVPGRRRGARRPGAGPADRGGPAPAPGAPRAPGPARRRRSVASAPRRLESLRGVGCAPGPPGSGRWRGGHLDRPTSACTPGAGCSPPTTWSASSSAATA